MGFQPEDREKLGRIEQHLKQLNGSVERHEKNINDLSNRVDWNRDKIYFGIGGVSLLIILLQLYFSGAVV